MPPFFLVMPEAAGSPWLSLLHLRGESRRHKPQAQDSGEWAGEGVFLAGQWGPAAVSHCVHREVVERGAHMALKQ